MYTISHLVDPLRAHASCSQDQNGGKMWNCQDQNGGKMWNGQDQNGGKMWDCQEQNGGKTWDCPDQNGGKASTADDQNGVQDKTSREAFCSKNIIAKHLCHCDHDQNGRHSCCGQQNNGKNSFRFEDENGGIPCCHLHKNGGVVSDEQLWCGLGQNGGKMSCSTNQNGEETLFHINQNGDNQCFHAVPNSGETSFHEDVMDHSGDCFRQKHILEDTGGGENQDGAKVQEIAAAAPPSPSKGTYRWRCTTLQSLLCIYCYYLWIRTCHNRLFKPHLNIKVSYFRHHQSGSCVIFEYANLHFNPIRYCYEQRRYSLCLTAHQHALYMLNLESMYSSKNLTLCQNIHAKSWAVPAE